MITELHMEKAACFKAAVKISPEKKITLIYGLNGSGKSTISNFLYDKDDYKYSNCKIKEDSEHEILVYNQRFITDYFYEEDSLKGIFTLSKENKDVLEAINLENTKLATLEKQQTVLEENKLRIARQIDATRNEAIEQVWEIKQKYAGGDRVLEYCLDGLKRKERLHEHLTSITFSDITPEYSIDDLKKEVGALKGENAHQINEIEEFIFGGHDIEDASIFNKIIVGSQEGSVAEFINNMGNSDWVKKGLEFLPDVTTSSNLSCPFCQESTLTNDLVNSIKAVFNDSYDRDISLINSHKDSYIDLKEGLISGNIEDITVIDKEMKKSWNSAINDIQSHYRENKLLIDKKINTPSLPVELSSSREAVKTLNNLIHNINSLIQLHNEKLNNKKQSLNEIKSRFWLLVRHGYGQTFELADKTINRLGKELELAINDISKQQGEVNNLKSNIVSLRKKTVNIEEAIENINSGLEQIGVDGFSVIKYGDNLYKLQRTDESGNAFHSLSEGEKTVISFLYFLELCKGQSSSESTPRKKVVVIDDPISSLSHIYVFNIGQLIKRVVFNSDLFEQAFVLTHSLYFFYELTHTNKENRSKLQNLFRIIKNRDGSDIVTMHYEEIQNDYQTYWSIVKDDASPPALIANCMRNIIEYFFNFVQNKSFNNVFQSPQLSDDKYQAFSRYMNRESHSLGQNIFDIKEFDYATFRKGLSLVFDECGYIDHYNVMMK